MLTHCPACSTHFRVTAEQLKARSGRVRCGECQNVFNALDGLIEEPLLVAPPLPAATAEMESEVEFAAVDVAMDVELAVPPAPTFEPEPQPELVDRSGQLATVRGELVEPHSPCDRPSTALCAPGIPLRGPASGRTDSPELDGQDALPEPGSEREVELEPKPEPEPAPAEPAAASEVPPPEDWKLTLPVPPPPPRRWPWAIGGALALAALALQAVLAFRVQLAVLWPPAKPALVALCDIAGCEVGLPARINQVGIEASDLHPDNERKGRLALAATLKNRAPFPQQFPHLELTLTDTADKAIARKVLAPADYLPRATDRAAGMPPHADVTLAFRLDSGELAASGYRLYLFYP